MKTKVLVYIDRKDKSLGMRIASQGEFTQILQKNKTLPLEERRLFVKDVIADKSGLDVMYLETDLIEYRRWNNEHTIQNDIRKKKKNYEFLSMDALYSNGNEGALTDFVADSFCVENTVLEKDKMQRLHAELEKWQPWANDVLNLYLNEDKRKVCRYLREKHGYSERQARHRIKMFEKFLTDFFASDGQFQG